MNRQLLAVIASIGSFSLLSVYSCGLVPSSSSPSTSSVPLEERAESLPGGILPVALPSTGAIAEVNAVAEKITVRIDLPNTPGCNGSGVIIAKQKNTYTILTAEHVVRDAGTCDPRKIEVVTHDGRRYLANKRTLKTIRGADLAVLQFRSRRSYQVATLANYENKEGGRVVETLCDVFCYSIYENMEEAVYSRYVFVSGWPASQKNSGEPSRLLTIGRLYGAEEGRKNAHDRLSFTYGYELVYSNATAPGMSGGPVLDSRGRVIGIHGRAEGGVSLDRAGKSHLVYLGYSLGVPVKTFLNLIAKVEMEPGMLQVETLEPPRLTEQEKSEIRQSLLNNLKVYAPADSSNAIAWLNYGNQLWRLQQYDEALAAIDRATQIQPDFYQAWYARGRTLVVLAKDERRRSEPYNNERSIEDRKGARLRWDSLIEQALKAFDRAIKESKGEFAPAWRERGSLISLSSNYHEMREKVGTSLDKAIEIDPKDFSAYMLRANYLDGSGLFQDAIADYGEAIKIYPDSFEAYLGRAGACQRFIVNFFRLKDASSKLKKQCEDNRIQDYSQAIEIRPDKAYVYLSRGNVRYEQGDYQGAIEDYKKSADLSANEQTANMYSLAMRSSVEARIKLGDYQGAIADSTKIIEINEDRIKTMSEYLNNNASNMQAIHKLQNQYFNLIDTYKKRGVFKIKIGDRGGAVKDYKEILKLCRNQPTMAPEESRQQRTQRIGFCQQEAREKIRQLQR